MLSAAKPFSYPHALIQRSVMPAFIVLYALLSLWAAVNIFVGSNFMSDWFRPPEIQHRPLIHMTSVVLTAFIPSGLEEAAAKYLIRFREGELMQSILHLRYADTHDPKNIYLSLISDQHIFFTTVKMTVVYLTICLFIWMMYKLAAAIFPETRAYALVAPVIGLLTVFPFAPEYAYSYDFAELFFSCAILYALYKERMGLYFLLLAIGTLNKETTLFGICFFVVWFFTRMPQRLYVKMVLAQLLVFGAVRLVVSIWLGPTQDITYQFQPLRAIFALYNYDFTNLIVLLVIVMLVSYRWQEKPLFLRYALWMIVPNMVAYILLCSPYEYRDLYWCMPPMFILASHTLVQMAGVAHLPIFRPKQP